LTYEGRVGSKVAVKWYKDVTRTIVTVTVKK
jgi:hypothetical protein